MPLPEFFDVVLYLMISLLHSTRLKDGDSDGYVAPTPVMEHEILFVCFTLFKPNDQGFVCV